MPTSTPSSRLGYLLKHAQARFSALQAEALAPLGVTGRELAVLLAIAAGDNGSQAEAARRLGVDRTTMVGLVDTLVDKGLVERRQDAADRRRNVVELTAAGDRVRQRGTAASGEVERAFLSGLSRAQAKALREALAVVAQNPLDTAP